MANVPRFDWSQFQLGIYIRATPDDLFDRWATSEGLTRWFLRAADFAPSEGPPPSKTGPKVVIPPFDDLDPRAAGERCQAKDRYRWEWYYNGGIAGEGWISDVRPPTKLVFTFGDRMEVEVRLRKQRGLCEVNLRQFNIPITPLGRSSMHLGCRVAWAFFLANLKSVVEGGLDLRETEGARTRQLHLVNI